MSSYSGIQLQPKFDMMSLNLVVFSLFLVILLWFFSKWFSKSIVKRNLPLSPRRLPILGNLHQLGSLAHQSLRSLAQKYGPVMFLHFGSIPTMVISSADAACLVMKTYDLIFSDRPYLSAVAQLSYNRRGVAVASYGEHWRQLKGIFVHQLLSNKKVSEFRGVREQEIALMVEKVKGFSSSSSPVNLSAMITSATNDIVCRSAFGRKYGEGEEGKRFKLLFSEFMNVSATVSIGTFIPCLKWIDRINGFDARVARLAKELDQFLDIMVQDRLDNGLPSSSDKANKAERGEDLLDILLRIHKDHSRVASIDRDSVKALILDVFSAGTDSTAAPGEWVMSELIRHPNVMKRLQKEVREILNGKPDITDDDIDKMAFLKAVIKETLRLHPPSPLLVPRAAREDAEIMGYHVAAGTMVMINAWAIGRDPASWDKPEDFLPDRFLNSFIDYKGQDFQLIPFGAGRRGCPGMSFAMATIELMLANLLQKFDWELPDGAKGEDLDMTEGFGLSIRRENPLLAFATPISFN